MKNVESLQALYVKLGGALTDTYDNICNGEPVSNYTLSADVIAAIAQVVGSGSGAALPEVTAEDNGDFLCVVDGAWAKATVPSAESEAY